MTVPPPGKSKKVIAGTEFVGGKSGFPNIGEWQVAVGKGMRAKDSRHLVDGRKSARHTHRRECAGRRSDDA